LNVKLLAFDSMGVRSMATLVETSAGSLLIDPGAALAPRRYNMPPHSLEIQALREALNKIYRALSRVDYVVITHYHRDHYLYRAGEQVHYEGKVIYAKNMYVDINPSQKIRAHVLFRKMGIESLAKQVVFADGKTIDLGGVKLVFSHPLPHGDCNSKLGYVLSVTVIEDGFTLTHASDTQGAICKYTLNYLVEIPHDFLIISGPPTYIKRGSNTSIIENLARLIKSSKSNITLILDHHILRDRDYNKYFNVLRSIREDVKVLTAAEFMDEEIRQLEAYRKELWQAEYFHGS
jgi:predicted metallo-beta-lactamase superfamily hydrolase